MLKASEIISKEIISIYECESIGTIKNIVFNDNLTKVEKFVFFNDDTDMASCLRANNILSFSEDGIVIKNLSKVDFFADEENNPINKKIFTISSIDYGKISDIILDEKFNVIKLITSKQKEFLPNEILKLGNSICIINDSNEKVKISSFKPKLQINNTNVIENIQVKIFNMDEKDEKPITILPKLPTRITTNLQNLLGKKVSKTITGHNNEVIIKQFSTISKHTLEMAKRHNKTNELIFNVM